MRKGKAKESSYLIFLIFLIFNKDSFCKEASFSDLLGEAGLEKNQIFRIQ
jgi:hypothetical protein